MKRQSFTLIEMLVVVGIIAILAGLIIPAVGLARTTARTSECMNNQSQTMKIVTQAMNDNKQFLVSGNDFAYNPGSKAGWTRYLFGDGDATDAMAGKKSYLQNMTAFRCPGFQYANKQDLAAIDKSKRDEQLKLAYGMMFRSSAETGATFAGFDFRGTKLLKYKDGSKKYDISPGSLALGGCASTTSAPYDTAEALLYSGSSWTGKFVKIHGDKTNMFFLDGHAESLAQAAFKTKYSPDANDNEAKLLTDSGWIDPEK